MGHQCDYERLRYCLPVANENRPVHVSGQARTLADKPMAFRLLHSRKDALRYALRSQYAGLGSRIGSDCIDHCGAFGHALRVLCHCFRCDNHEREQQ